MNDNIPVEVNISDIDDNDLFRVSRKNYQADLPASLKLSGMLEFPIIIKSGSGYVAMSCHNRIKILRDTGARSLKCYVLDTPDLKAFMNYISLKSYRNELGPVGRLKSFKLLTEIFKIDEEVRNEFCKKNLKIPEEIIKDTGYLEKIFLFKDSLINYLDEKNISYRIIKDLINLPPDWLGIINNWTGTIQIRANFFKMIIDCVYDIYRSGNSISVIESITTEDDKILYNTIYRIRYPRYVNMKMESDAIIRELTSRGLSIDFPEYFDRSFITIKLNIDKKLDCDTQLKKISDMNSSRLEELISLL